MKLYEQFTERRNASAQNLPAEIHQVMNADSTYRAEPSEVVKILN